MADINEFEEYEMTDEDIEKAINHLKNIDPEHATREDAIEYLEYYRIKIHALGHQLTDEELHKLYDEFSQKRSTRDS